MNDDVRWHSSLVHDVSSLILNVSLRSRRRGKHAGGWRQVSRRGRQNRRRASGRQVSLERVREKVVLQLLDLAWTAQALQEVIAELLVRHRLGHQDANAAWSVLVQGLPIRAVRGHGAARVRRRGEQEAALAVGVAERVCLQLLDRGAGPRRRVPAGDPALC